MRIGELHLGGRERINIRSLNLSRPIAAEIPKAQVIRKDDHNIRF